MVHFCVFMAEMSECEDRLRPTSFSGINLLGPLPKGLGILTPKSCKTKNDKNIQFKWHKKMSAQHFSFLQTAIISFDPSAETRWCRFCCDTRRKEKNDSS